MRNTTSVVPLAAVCGAFLCFSVTSSGRLAPAAAAAEEAAPAAYRCPMHPAVVEAREGRCPLCGMRLEPARETAQAGADAAPAAAAAPAPAADAAAAAAPAPAAAPAAEGQDALGIVLAPVERAGGARTLRLPGRVVPDETRVWLLNAGMAGSFRDVSPVVSGSRVRKDQVLGSFYPDSGLNQFWLLIQNTRGNDISGIRTARERELDAARVQGSLARSNLQQRLQELENMGVSALQRDEVVHSGLIPETVRVLAPADGVVLERNVNAGLKFNRGYEFFRIADLTRVWVIADVFPQDARHVRAGMRAQVSIPEQDLTLAATIRDVLPQADPATRTLRVRLELANADLALKPGMFVDVRVDVTLPAAVVVPAGAIVDSGRSRAVWVQTASGGFEARRVKTAWRSGDRVAIVDGLALGERVVTSGTFFLDSETRFRAPHRGEGASEQHAAPAAGPSPGAHAGGRLELPATMHSRVASTP